MWWTLFYLAILQFFVGIANQTTVQVHKVWTAFDSNKNEGTPLHASVGPRPNKLVV